MKAKILIAAIVLICLVACGGKPLPPGCTRTFDHSTWYMQPIYGYSGNQITIITWLPTEQKHYKTTCVTVTPVS